MKMVARRGLFLCILCILFLCGLGFMTFNLLDNGEEWAMKPFNSHVYQHGQFIATGEIKDKNGVMLAESKDGKRVYSEDKDTRMSTLHAIGNAKISSGVQSKFRSDFIGYDIFTGVHDIKKYGKGNDMTLTIDSKVNNVALDALGDKKGTIAVVNYKTGDIVAMVSTPTYDINDIPGDIETNEDYSGVYMNRFLQGLYTPGSTFKVVTSISALENIGDSIYDKKFKCNRIYDVDGIKEDNIICNANHGTISFENALAKSCNVAFSKIAIELGPKKLSDTAKRLGVTSPVVIDGKLSSATGKMPLAENAPDALTGWTGIGQGDTLVTPAAMLRIMCAIANDGIAVPFHIVDSVTDQKGKEVKLDEEEAPAQLMSLEVAGKMKKLMRNNVKKQYKDSRYKGLNLCAKSGTAQIDDIDAHNTAWFVGFMDDEENPYAFVVVAEHGNSGSQTAGPMANKVLQAIVKDNKEEKDN